MNQSTGISLHSTSGEQRTAKLLPCQESLVRQMLGRIQRQTSTRTINQFVMVGGAYAELGNQWRDRVTHARRINGRLFLKIGFQSEVVLIAPVSLECARSMDTMTVNP